MIALEQSACLAEAVFLLEKNELYLVFPWNMILGQFGRYSQSQNIPVVQEPLSV